jgi:hypothetical protein
MNVQTEVLYRMVIYSILCAVLLPLITLFIWFIVLTNVSWGVTFLFLLMFVIEYFLISSILTYGFGKFAALANIIYTLLVVFVSLFAALNPSIS